jgi:hypothetical protein
MPLAYKYIQSSVIQICYNKYSENLNWMRHVLQIPVKTTRFLMTSGAIILTVRAGFTVAASEADLSSSPPSLKCIS